MHPIFPVADGGGIDAEFVGKLPLREPTCPACRDEAFGEGGGFDFLLRKYGSEAGHLLSAKNCAHTFLLNADPR